MKTQCPACGTPFALPDVLRSEIVLCGNCQAAFVVDAPTGQLVPAAAGSDPPAGPRVLFAHESAEVCDVGGRILREAGFRVLMAREGHRAREIIRTGGADALVTDVALPEVAGFQLCDWLRAVEDESLRRLPIVLIASVFRRTAYKRRPARLYGADEYVEQHHLPDQLVPKLKRLLGMERADPAAPPRALPTAVPTQQRPTDHSLVMTLASEEQRLFAGGGAPDQTEESRARRIAWVIVNDVVLYNEDEVVQRIAEGEAPPALQKALSEGRRLYLQLVGDPHRSEGGPVDEPDYFQEAYERYLRLRNPSSGS